MIKDVVCKKLNPIPDERGRLMEILRNDEEVFEKFGQLYMTSAYPGVVKAWHYHKKQTDHFCVVKGMIKLVLYDDREGSLSRGEVQEIFMGEEQPLLVKIPKGVYHGFQGIGICEALVLNCPTEVYNYKEPDEYRTDPFQNDIPYEWNKGL